MRELNRVASTTLGWNFQWSRITGSFLVADQSGSGEKIKKKKFSDSRHLYKLQPGTWQHNNIPAAKLTSDENGLRGHMVHPIKVRYPVIHLLTFVLKVHVLWKQQLFWWYSVLLLLVGAQ